MKTVFFDVDTQMDFLYPAGALYVPGAEKIVDTLARLNRYAASRGIPVISTVDAHAEADPEFAVWPPHCIDGTLGQRKPEATLFGKRLDVPEFAADIDPAGAEQLVLRKLTTDCFTNPNLGSLLSRLRPERFVVYGVVTEICVRNAVIGLLKTGAAVEVVRDAIRELSPDAAAAFFAELTAAGGRLTTVDAVCAGGA